MKAKLWKGRETERQPLLKVRVTRKQQWPVTAAAAVAVAVAVAARAMEKANCQQRSDPAPL